MQHKYPTTWPEHIKKGMDKMKDKYISEHGLDNYKYYTSLRIIHGVRTYYRCPIGGLWSSKDDGFGHPVKEEVQ
jgi:hypothetical protein